MAVAVLSPWPVTPMALVAATECVKRSIVGGEDLDDSRIAALGSTAAAFVERFAPAAPQAVKNECVIRTAGYLHARMPHPFLRFTAGGVSADLRERFASPDPLRNSGARAMLAPWRSRRALPIEEAGS